MELLSAAQEAWDDAVELGEQFGVRNSQASVLAPTGTDRPHARLRHHRGRARPRSGEDQEARRRRDDVHRQPDRPPCAGQARLHARAGRRHHLLHRRAQVDRGCTAPGRRSPGGVRLLDGRQHDPLHRARPDDGGGAALHQRGHQQVRRGRDPSRHRRRPHPHRRPARGREPGQLPRRDPRRGVDRWHPQDRCLLLRRHPTGAPGRAPLGPHRHRDPEPPRPVAGSSGLDWKRLDEIEPGDYVATKYGDELWSELRRPLRRLHPDAGLRLAEDGPDPRRDDRPAGASSSVPTRRRATPRVRPGPSIITNSEDAVLEEIAEAARVCFDVDAKIRRPADRCPSVEISSKTIVEFLEYLGCGERASTKRIPDAVLRSPRELVLSFLQGLALDAYTHASTTTGASGRSASMRPSSSTTCRPS